MKKLNFNEVKAKELLDIKSMRNVRGGFGTGTCGVYVGRSALMAITDTWTGAVYYEEVTIYGSQCNISKQEALNDFAYGGINWCCDSCSETKYCG